MRALLDLVAPTHCVACGHHSDGELCERCAHDVIVITEPVCERCGGPQAAGRSCACDALDGFARARSLVAFAEPARALTLSVKRRARRETVAGIGALLAELARAQGFEHGADVVTSVPGGKAARRRGFDHAELLAREVARALGLRTSAALRRRAEGPRQADVPFAQRHANVRERFEAKPIRGGVILVDDVFTTGATAQACAIALRRAGARSVDVLTWARTLRKAW